MNDILCRVWQLWLYSVHCNWLSSQACATQRTVFVCLSTKLSCVETGYARPILRLRLIFFTFGCGVPVADILVKSSKEKYEFSATRRSHTIMSAEDIANGKKSTWDALEITGTSSTTVRGRGVERVSKYYT